MGECHDIIFYQPLSLLMDKLNTTVDTMEDSYLLQRFIHENLARVTKIVGHVVDGIHRVTALDYVLTGTRTHNNEEEEKAIKNYGDRSPHQDKKVTMTIYTPQKINEELLTFMKALSSRIQCSANKQTLHNIRDILCNEIKILAKKCDSDDDGVPHLWSCLGVVFNVLAGRILGMSERDIMRKGIHRDSKDGQRLLNELEDLHGRIPVTGASMGRILEDYISFWVENMSQKIIHQLGHSSHRSEFQTLSSFDDEGDDERDESARRLFKHIYQVDNQTQSKFHIFPCKPTNMQINSFLGAEADGFVRATRSTSDFSSVFKEDRYKRKGHNDVEFISCQVLLLSRTCVFTQTCLTKLFSSLRPEFKQYTSAGYDDALRWTANFFHNASDSVNKSYQPWKSAFFVLDQNHPVQCLPEQVIYLCLWGSAIEVCAGFFSKLGMKAEWPGDLLHNRDEIEQALGGERHSDIMSSRVGEGGSGLDLLTYITISHALSSSRMGRGIRKKIQSERLSRSCGADIVRYSKAKAPSELSRNTIGGNDTADPRGKEGERLIKIVSHGIIDTFDQETHFTANIGQHYDLLLNGVDTAYCDALNSLNSIEEDDNMDDSCSPSDVDTEAHHPPLEDEEDLGIIENREGEGGGGGVGILEDDFIDGGEVGGGGEGGEGGEGDDNNLSVVGGGEGGDDGSENENRGGGGEGGDDGGENENGGGGGEGGDDGGENENGGGGGGEARGNRRSSRVGGNPNPISGVGGGGGPVSDSRRRRRRAGRGRQGPVSGATSRRRRRRDGRRPRGGASAQPNDEMPAGASVASDETSDKSVVGKDAQVLAKSLEMMKIFDDLQGLGLFDDYKGTSDIENSIHAYEHTIPQDICTVPSCGEYNHHLSRLCEKHMTQFITLETKPEEITVLQAAVAEVGAVGDAFEDELYLARATGDGGYDDDQDNFSFDLFATSLNHSGDEVRDLDNGNQFGETIVGLLVAVRQEYDEELDEASVRVADFIT